MAAQVGVRAHQELADQLHVTAVTRQQRDRGGEIAAGTVTADHQSARVGDHLRRVSGQPSGRGKAVLDRRWELRLRREPVLDRDDDASRRVGEASADLVAEFDAAQEPAPAVEVDQHA